jgi:uncharacterized protein (TIGR00369 family)
MSSSAPSTDIDLPPPHFGNPFLDLLGAESTGLSKGWAQTVLQPRPELTNMHGAIHGGVLMTLLDTTMARAAMAQQGFRLSVVSTGVTVNFLAPGHGPLTTTAKVTGGGKSTCFCEAEVTDTEGRSVAKAMGTFKYRRPPAPAVDGGVSTAESIE